MHLNFKFSQNSSKSQKFEKIILLEIHKHFFFIPNIRNFNRKFPTSLSFFIYKKIHWKVTLFIDMGYFRFVLVFIIYISMLDDTTSQLGITFLCNDFSLYLNKTHIHYNDTLDNYCIAERYPLIVHLFFLFQYKTIQFIEH